MSYDILKSFGMFMCPFKIKFVSILTLIFKDKESGKMSARGAHVLKVSEGELTNPPVCSLCSLNIDDEYVFISLNTTIILNIMQWMVIIIIFFFWYAYFS